MAVTLTLGSVTFADFEVPESIRHGGEQALVVHKLPGGTRQVDAMGADHKDITWSGRFRGFNAETRAKQLDAYRISGQEYTLTWSSFRYTVVVRSFEPDYQQPFEIPYAITCLVELDQTAPPPATAPGLDDIINGQIGSLLGFPLTIQGITDGITAIQTTKAAIGNLKTASQSGILSLAGAVVSTQTVATSSFNTINAALGNTLSANPLDMAANLSGQAQAMGQLNQLYQVSTTLGSMKKALA